jgi:hypothetical protein
MTDGFPIPLERMLVAAAAVSTPASAEETEAAR